MLKCACFAGESLAGRAVAIAEGNALGKGPVVFELPSSGIALICGRAALGDPVFMQLEVRSTFLHVVSEGMQWLYRVALMRRRAALGDPVFMQLEVQLAPLVDDSIKHIRSALVQLAWLQ